METKKQKVDEEAEKLKPKMRILCDVCEIADATIICSADEAALCAKCDIEVHEANMLASKHQRVHLINPVENSPRCDICQEKTGHFFCMEDRALLCRNCDLAIHTVNPMSSSHQRFLVTGARVALTALDRPASPRPASGALLCPPLKANDNTHPKFPRYCTQLPPDNEHDTANGFEKPDEPNESFGIQGRSGNPSRKSSISDPVPETFPGWRVDEMLNYSDFPVCFSFGDIQSNSKGDGTKFGDSDWVADTCLSDDEVSESCPHEVPKMPSPPTASGLSSSQRTSRTEKYRSTYDILRPSNFNTLVVPEIDVRSNPESPYYAKRRKTWTKS